MREIVWETTEQQNKRLDHLIIGMIVLVGILGGRLFYWHLLSPDRQEVAVAEETTKIRYTPRRGTIRDATGHLLALNIPLYEINCDLTKIETEEDLRKVAKGVAPLIGETEGEILHKLEKAIEERKKAKASGGKGLDFVVLARHFLAPTAAQLITTTAAYSDAVTGRTYPEGTLMGPLVGFVNMDGEGASGLESAYNAKLTGKAGEEIIWDGNWGRHTHNYTPVQNGADLTLTINRVIQWEVERMLEDAVKEQKAEGGSIIVMEPKTGAILAMASYPTYDPNQFAKYAAISYDYFINPCTSKQYEPGSVFKVITMAAALDTGAVTRTTTYYDAGLLNIGGRKIRNHDRKAHGTTTMEEVLIKSLNVGAATISIKMGSKVFYPYVSAFGFGQPTGIELQGEATGTVHMPGDPKWSDSDLATNAYGQGIAVTPLQMINAICAVANSGYLMRPYVVDEIRLGGVVTRTHPVALRQVISKETARELTDMLVKVVGMGCPAAAVEGYRIAGKTGTAQIPHLGSYDNDDPTAIIASFVGYAPADAPRFAILVKIDKPKVGHWGTTVAAPVFRKLARRLFTLLDIPPDEVHLAMRSPGTP